LLKAKPSEYITQGNWFFAAEPEESTLPYVMERIGDRKLIFRLRLSALGRHVPLRRFDDTWTQRHL
jgi:hypothetical protein